MHRGTACGAVAVGLAMLVAACDLPALLGPGSKCHSLSDCEEGLTCVNERCSTDVSSLAGSVPSFSADAANPAAEMDAAMGDAAVATDGGAASDAASPRDASVVRDASAPRDAAAPDANAPDANTPDAARADAAGPDASTPDASVDPSEAGAEMVDSGE